MHVDGNTCTTQTEYSADIRMAVIPSKSKERVFIDTIIRDKSIETSMLPDSDCDSNSYSEVETRVNVHSESSDDSNSN